MGGGEFLRGSGFWKQKEQRQVYVQMTAPAFANGEVWFSQTGAETMWRLALRPTYRYRRTFREDATQSSLLDGLIHCWSSNCIAQFHVQHDGKRRR